MSWPFFRDAILLLLKLEQSSTLMDGLRILFKTKSDRFVEKRAYVFGNMSLEQIIEQVQVKNMSVILEKIFKN